MRALHKGRAMCALHETSPGLLGVSHWRSRAVIGLDQLVHTGQEGQVAASRA